MKKIILTQKQLDEISGADSTYFDGLALNPDMGNIFSTEVVADGSVEDGYADNITGDDIANDLTNDWRGNAKLGGMGPITIREMSKKEWEASFLSEESAHGNKRLNMRRFGASYGDNGMTYNNATVTKHRQKEDLKTSQTGQTQQERNAALARYQNRIKSNPNLNTAISQLNGAQNTDKTLQNGKTPGTKIASAPKTGVGTAHSKKNNGPEGGVLVN